MRGTQFGSSESYYRSGIIPAYAGNTSRSSLRCPLSRDHPRVCGEHTSKTLSRSASKGSSPRMRGTLSHAVEFSLHAGIIPAYAGNTILLSPTMVFRWDHPRVCGEHSFAVCWIRRKRGSSPRMRGTLLLVSALPASAGIIPAYAGNTPAAQMLECRTRDHPRVCGEHLGSPVS